MSVALLVASAGMLWLFVRKDAAEYAAFKLLTLTADRQRCYRRWVFQSFVVFCVMTLLGLTLLHRLTAVMEMPHEFAVLARSAQRHLPIHAISSSFLAGFGGAVLVGMLASTVVLPVLAKRAKPMVVGDIEPLLPRNWPETAHTALLALNAGVSEELYFRLYLPLLLIVVGMPAVYAFVLAGLVFGLIHAYQGVTGVLATTVLGGVLTMVYLASGSLVLGMAVHAALDLLALVVRPSLQRMVATRA